jgi:hypothetical protein
MMHALYHSHWTGNRHLTQALRKLHAWCKGPEMAFCVDRAKGLKGCRWGMVKQNAVGWGIMLQEEAGLGRRVPPHAATTAHGRHSSETCRVGLNLSWRAAGFRDETLATVLRDGEGWVTDHSCVCICMACRGNIIIIIVPWPCIPQA